MRLTVFAMLIKSPVSKEKPRASEDLPEVKVAKISSSSILRPRYNVRLLVSPPQHT